MTKMNKEKLRVYIFGIGAAPFQIHNLIALCYLAEEADTM